MPPQVLAVTVVLQALYGLPDYEAVQELRCDLRWKAACGLGLLDPGFDPSLLTYFRRRLARSGDPGRLFAKVREVVAATGVLAGKHRRALDSTVLDDAVATQDTVTQLIAAIRRVIREVPGAAEAAAARCTAHDYRDPGKPKIAWDDEQARAALVSALVNDALALLDHLPAQPGGRPRTRSGCWPWSPGRTSSRPRARTGPTGGGGSPAAPRRTAWSPSTDPDARHIHKNRTRHQDGFKAHVSFEPETGLFTAVELTGGSGAGSHEAAVAVRLLAGEQEPVTVLGDTAYGTGELRAHLRDAGHAAVIKPPPLQQAVPGGFTIDDFTVDEQAGTVTCPAGHTVAAGPPARRRHPPGPVQGPVPRLPAAPALHHLQDRAGPQRPPAARPAGRRPPRRRRPRLARRVPPVAAPGRTGHRLAGRPRQPPRPLPRHHQQQRLARQPGRRPQPPPADQPRAHPHHRRHLGTRITTPGPGGLPEPENPRKSQPVRPDKIFSSLLVNRFSRDIDMATDSTVMMGTIVAVVVEGLNGRGWRVEVIGVDHHGARMMATDQGSGEQCELERHRTGGRHLCAKMALEALLWWHGDDPGQEHFRRGACGAATTGRGRRPVSSGVHAGLDRASRRPPDGRRGA